MALPAPPKSKKMVYHYLFLFSGNVFKWGGGGESLGGEWGGVDHSVYLLRRTGGNEDNSAENIEFCFTEKQTLHTDLRCVA